MMSLRTLATLVVLPLVPFTFGEAQAPTESEEEPTAATVDNPEVRAALTNAEEVDGILRRSYRSLNVHRALGEGTVVLRLMVGPDGTVVRAEVLGSSGQHPWLNGIALRAARRMRFQLPPRPKNEGSAALPYPVVQTVSFTN